MEAASRQALAVDMIAASAAASTRPRRPTGSTALTICANAGSPSASGGRKTRARRADQRAGQRVDQAVQPDADAAVARHLDAARGEHALPDILADDDAEEIQNEEREDLAGADVSSSEKNSAGSRACIARQAARVHDRARQQDEEKSRRS